MERVTWAWLLLLVALVTQTARVSSGGFISFRFIEYDNPSGTGSNGHCCDGRWNVCLGHSCDHMFTFCIHGEIQETNDMHSSDQCEYFLRRTGDFENQNTVTFGRNMEGVRNPIVVQAPTLPEEMSLKIRVEDEDDFNDNDNVDFLRLDLQPEDLAMTFSRTGHDFTIAARTTMLVNIRSECADDFYGPLCDTFCQPPEGAWGQNFICDPATGEVVCAANGDVCQMCEENCSPGFCQGRGDVHPREWHCLCPAGYHAINDVAEENLGMEICSPLTTPTKTPPTTTTSTTTPAPVVWVARPNTDCDAVAANDHRYQDGVYSLHPAQSAPFNAYCDMSARGWTVIQRRQDGSVDFNRGWTDYRDGFGELGPVSSFWLGLEHIYWLTNQRRFKLLITVRVADGSFKYAEYSHFYIDSERENYALHVSGFSGSAGDALNVHTDGNSRLHNGMPFSTYDQDNDHWDGGNCAQVQQSAWWFNDCSYGDLNGPYVAHTNGWPTCPRTGCISWRTIPNYYDYSLRSTEMKIQPDLSYDPYSPY